ncbi:hypothetical protein NQ314_009238 [Rhamnusium bicolor]|uniref:HTH CENPB-type domain-containing protein n=1 Tax=Rhamnusium bicolor TaxID=1586634 RepID=A0AAV8Y470_9CUCU|nr:hypothetical protein NQ314_009238 [Rhamnusium bicolor]
MPRLKKKKTDRVLNTDAIKSAILAIRSGSSIRKAAKDNGIDKETLRKHYKNVGETNEETIVISQNYGWNKIFTKEQEDILVNYILKCCEMGYGFSREQARKLAYEMAVKNDIKIPDNWKKSTTAGIEWYKGFYKRHPQLSLRKPEATSLMLRRHPNFMNGSRIFNLDETGNTTVQMTHKVLATKGVRQVSQNTSAEKGTLVSTCCIISSQGINYPPVMVFPRINFKNVMTTNAYPGTLGLAEKSGWMTSANFKHVMTHFVKVTSSSKANPSLLICDNHESHLSIDALDIAKENGVTILTLYPHTSHKLQPLDVAVFGPYQNHYNRAVNNWMFKNPGQTVTIYEIASFVHEAMNKAMTPENIRAGFRASGIFPFNRDIFSDRDFGLSELELPPKTSLNETCVADITDKENNITNGVVRETAANIQAENEASPPQTPASLENIKKKNITPEEYRGYPKARARKTVRKGRKKGNTIIATDTPVKKELEEAFKKKRSKKPKHPRPQSSSSEDDEQISVHSDTSCAEGEEDVCEEDEEILPLLDKETFPPLKNDPQIDDFGTVQ